MLLVAPDASDRSPARSMHPRNKSCLNLAAIGLVSVLRYSLNTALCDVRVLPVHSRRNARKTENRLMDAEKCRPMKVIVAVDGSAGAKHAVKSVASRPWPNGSVFRVVSVFNAPLPSNAAGGGIPADDGRAGGIDRQSCGSDHVRRG